MVWLFTIHTLFIITKSEHDFYTHYFFNNNKKKHNFYRGEYSMKKFCANLKQHATKIINWEKKKMLHLTKKQKNKFKTQTLYHICKQEFNAEYNENQNY